LKVLVTGAAGFIGMHACKALLERGDEVVGLDNLNDYYDTKLKQNRLAQLVSFNNFRFIKLDIASKKSMTDFFEAEKFNKVIHLAAQAGVRYSITNPQAYVESNLVGFVNILEGCRHNAVQHLVYASSSSVYGGNTKMPFAEHDNVDHPVSLYAATKKSNELMAHTYSHLYGLPTTGLRFFTVYGPWGRPDMAPFLFVNAINNNEPIKIFNHGNMQRDFTYVDDIVEAVVRVIDKNATSKDGYDLNIVDPSSSNAPYRVFNIGNSSPVPLMEFVESIELALGKKAEKNYLPMQDGDVPATYADTQLLQDWVGFAPSTTLSEGIKKFVDWYVGYYK
jgi:UDP-glucuronate 4-epimerase